MGRLRIKKKDEVIPFRQTVAYRMMLLTGSIALFLFALYVLISAWRAGAILPLVSSAILSAVSGYLVFYNLDQMRDAKIPQHTLKKMRRR